MLIFGNNCKNINNSIYTAPIPVIKKGYIYYVYEYNNKYCINKIVHLSIIKQLYKIKYINLLTNNSQWYCRIPRSNSNHEFLPNFF